jgi:hypothetical protein
MLYSVERDFDRFICDGVKKTNCMILPKVMTYNLIGSVLFQLREQNEQ